jgi:hypothetical protein
VSGPMSTSRISCASWAAGAAYYGPGYLARTIRNFTGPDHISLYIAVDIHPKGTGAKMYTIGMALARRCRQYSTLSKGVRYDFSVRIGPSAGIGDQSQEIDYTETADGTVFKSQGTYIDVGDAMVSVQEGGAADAPLNRAAMPFAAIVAALRAAGY